MRWGKFLERAAPASPACLVLDVHLPGLGGLDLQAEMAARKIHAPIVIITGQGDIATTVRAMHAGVGLEKIISIKVLNSTEKIEMKLDPTLDRGAYKLTA